eukprot:747043-Hanusia_phi.AAC.3
MASKPERIEDNISEIAGGFTMMQRRADTRTCPVLKKYLEFMPECTYELYASGTVGRVNR